MTTFKALIETYSGRVIPLYNTEADQSMAVSFVYDWLLTAPEV